MCNTRVLIVPVKSDYIDKHDVYEKINNLLQQPYVKSLTSIEYIEFVSPFFLVTYERDNI